MDDKLELPFRQLLWQVFKLREAEKQYNLYLSYNNRKNVKYWQTKVDDTLATIGVDDQTDFKNMTITFIKQ